MATPAGDSVALTGNPLIDGLLSRHSWQLGADRVITYSLHNLANGSSWNSAEIAAVDKVFAAWEAAANMDFQRLGAPNNTSFLTSPADIAIGFTGLSHAYFLPPFAIAATVPPSTNFGSEFLAALSSASGISYTRSNYPNPEGDIFIDDLAYEWYPRVFPGDSGFVILLHEIGHALGLKHPHDNLGGRSFAHLGIDDLDSQLFTLMSYDVIPGSSFGYGNPITPMLLDILAIQKIYGPNMAYHTGNDVYQLPLGQIAQCIWDAGGHDTFSASTAKQSVSLDIAQAGRSDTGSAITFVAYNVDIEDVIGSAYDDEIRGNNLANKLTGNGGDDLIEAAGGNDNLGGGNGNDTLRGQDGKDVLNGGAGNDELIGGPDNDTLLGGIGNDLYIIDSISEIDKGIADAGFDTIRSSASYAMGAEQENLILTGNGNFNGTGNEFDNALTGNPGINALNGKAGDDMLNGGAGSDRLVGGVGNDIYIIDTVNEVDKNLTDNGIDLVKSTASYTLGPSQENLALLGTSALNGTGNAAANMLTGNSGANQLKGLGGNDLLKGGGGNDTLTGGPGSDNLRGGAGNDTLIFDANDLVNVDGGAGTDTLTVQGANVTADLVTLNATTPVFKGIEIISLGASGAQTVVLDEAFLLALSGTNTVLIEGTDVDAVDTQGLWTALEDIAIGTLSYHQFQSGIALLQVQAGIDTTGITEATAVIELSALDGTNGFQLSGEAASDLSGISVSAAGDVNGDGYADLLIGARGADPNGGSSGASYLVFGGSGGFASNLNLSALNGNNGFQISGESANDYPGRSVSAAGDVNGDGYADLLIGAFGADPNGIRSGASYLVFGGGGGFASNLELSALNGSNGFQLSGEAAYDHSGISVSAAGDVNGDGFADLLIGADRADPNGSFSGASYLVFGGGGGFASNLELSALNGSNGFQLSGEAANDYSGRSVSAAGDVNGDGFDDLLVGADGADPNGSFSGASYLVFGGSGGFASNLELSALNGSNGFQLSGAASDSSATSVSAAGDVNGDGFADLLISAHGASPNGSQSGASYLVFGGSGGFASNLELSALNGSNGFQISGEAMFDFTGRTVSAAGDVNGDGFADLLVGAPSADPNGSSSGASYLVFGGSGGFASNLNLSALNGSNGFQLSGEAADDFFGRSVSAAGDVNGDGFDDLLIGADGRDINGTDAGASYVVFGRNFRDEISDGNEGAAGDDTLTGTGTDEILIGGLGNDTLNGGGGADVLNGAAGDDAVNGDAGADHLEGGTGADALNGGDDKDRVMGDAGADSLDGDLGSDVLTGGGDNDIFLFNDTLGANNVDTIMDFGGAGAAALDVIHLENEIFTVLTATGPLSAANFVSNATGMAMDADDYIVYNTITGELFYDADGSDPGAAVIFAIIASDVDGLSAEDLVVV